MKVTTAQRSTNGECSDWRGFNFKIQGTCCALCNYIILYLTYIHIMEVSWNRSTPSHHPFLLGIFDVSLTIHKPSIWIAPFMNKPPYVYYVSVWWFQTFLLFHFIGKGCHPKPLTFTPENLSRWVQSPPTSIIINHHEPYNNHIITIY